MFSFRSKYSIERILPANSLHTQEHDYFVGTVMRLTRTAKGKFTVVLLDKHNQELTVHIEGFILPCLDQPCGQEAQEYVELIQGEKLLVDWNRVNSTTIESVVRLSSGEFLHDHLIKLGLAWPESDTSLVLEYAKKSKVGMWHGDTPIHPRKWLRRKSNILLRIFS
jgi:endonuclease YncB( thermonuclease family)